MTAGRHFSKENEEVKRKLFFHKKKTHCNYSEEN